HLVLSALVGAPFFIPLWRLWKFTIVPILFPNDPKELPYWVPILGHGVGFFKNSYKVLDDARVYFGNSKEPYAITVAGQSFYVLTAPADVQLLFNRGTSFSWMNFVRELYAWMDLSAVNIEKLWEEPPEERKALYPSQKVTNPNQMIADFQHRQLLPGENLDNISRQFISSLNELVSWQEINSNRPYVLQSSSHSVQVSLMEWTAHIFINTNSGLYWGKSLSKVAPHLTKSFMKWEEKNWKYVFQLPRSLSKDMYAAKDQLVDGFRDYFAQPQEKRSDASFFAKAAERELRDISFTDYDIGKVHMLHYWAINGNVHKVTFWTLAYLLHDQELLEKVREETRPAVIDDVPNVTYLLESCPRLEAIFLEVLRMVMSSSLMRFVTEPTLVGGKTLRKGYNVMAPYRQLHYDKDVWGENADEFDPERFLRNKNLAKSPSYRPFGGGQYLCPGRFLARRVVFTFVALALSRFELALDIGVVAGTEGGALKGS
ncbi:MAG: hypothetical protein Q9187_009061, partial [Circinaria calcarea]